MIHTLFTTLTRRPWRNGIGTPARAMITAQTTKIVATPIASPKSERAKISFQFMGPLPVGWPTRSPDREVLSSKDAARRSEEGVWSSSGVTSPWRDGPQAGQPPLPPHLRRGTPEAERAPHPVNGDDAHRAEPGPRRHPAHHLSIEVGLQSPGLGIAKPEDASLAGRLLQADQLALEFPLAGEEGLHDVQVLSKLLGPVKLRSAGQLRLEGSRSPTEIDAGPCS